MEDIERIVTAAVNKAFRDAERRKQPEPLDKIVTVAEAADELRQCSATLHNWRRAGKIKMVALGAGYGVRLSEIEYIKQYGTRPTK